MKINIIGWYDRNNCGDESFKSVFNEIFSGNEIYFTSNQSIENCDHYIIGGGDVVKSWYLDNISEDKLLNFIGVGLGYKSESELLKNRNCNLLYVRNKEDVDIFNEIGKEASYTPDIVFYLQKPTEIKKIIDTTNNKKKMAIVLTDHVNPNITNTNIKEFNYNEFFKWELSETLDYLSQYYQIYFIALSEYHYAHDNKMSIDIQSRMNNGYKTTLITESKDPHKLMDIIQQMDLLVSMKFHGLIFSTICNVPFINIGLSRKTNKFCSEMYLDDLSFNPRTFNKEDFLTKVKYVENNTVDIKEKLNQIDKKNKEILKNNIDKWKEMIK